MLHVTNGQSTLRGFEIGGVPGTYLAWEDPLHDGPVVAAESLEALSRVRARALADFGWGSLDAIDARFAERDRMLRMFTEHDETVLWFEHDLYDQLQLVQLLDWFSRRDLSGVHLSLVQVGPDWAGSDEPFHGLGQLSGPQLAALLPSRRPVTPAQVSTAVRTWQAFCAPEPTALVELARLEDPELPYLGPAMARLLAEYPSAANGLSRTEQQLLVSAALGARARQALYLQSQEFEACPWGDASIFLRIDGLAGGPNPALKRSGPDEFTLTDFGKRLLNGSDDWVTGSGGLDRWIGGVHLHGTTVKWRWVEEATALTPAVS